MYFDKYFLLKVKMLCAFVLAKTFAMNVDGYYGCSKMKTRILTRKFLFDILAPYNKLF